VLASANSETIKKILEQLGPFLPLAASVNKIPAARVLRRFVLTTTFGKPQAVGLVSR
jgi:hypothetical protein